MVCEVYTCKATKGWEVSEFFVPIDDAKKRVLMDDVFRTCKEAEQYVLLAYNGVEVRR